MAAHGLRDGIDREEQIRVTVFEESPGWEKPCGGGLPAKAVRRYPFLDRDSQCFSRTSEAELVAGNGEFVRFQLRGPLLVYSRADLNSLLLRRAEAAGTHIICDRIVNLNRVGTGWQVQGRTHSYEVDYLILAAGARTALRQLLALPLRASDLMLTFGYYTPAGAPVLRVQFFEDFEGYAWAFPRADHISVGICGKCRETTMHGLRDRLHGFMRRFGYPVTRRVFSHILPALAPASWAGNALAGNGWAMVGDAAGLVDPLTGEGIYFAMRSGELLAQALRAGSLSLYHENLWKEFGGKLAFAARLAPRFYRGKFLGKSSTTRLVGFCARSPAFMNLLQDLFEGSQSYPGLPARVYRTFSRGLLEMAAACIREKF